MYALPLEDRKRLAAYQRARYWTDEAFRLRCINRDRARKGKPPIASLDEMRPSRSNRDERGRFAG